MSGLPRAEHCTRTAVCSGLSVYLDSPVFVLCHYILGKTMAKTDS